MANKLTAFLNSGTNNYLTPQVSFTRVATDLVAPGVVGTFTSTAGVAPTTGSFGVNAQATPNLSVQISAGQLYVSATPTGGVAQNFSVTSDGAETVITNSNTTGSTVYDFIYIQADPNKLNNPAVTGLDVSSFITSRSTTPYSPTAAANGNSNGALANALLLAVVSVANNATTITNANITDARLQAGANAVSLPALSSWSPTYTGFSTAPTPSASNYVQLGKLVFAYLNAAAGTSNATSFTITLPLPAKNTVNIVLGQVTDSGTTAAGPGMLVLTAGSNIATVYKDGANTLWSATGSKNFRFGQLMYEAQ